MNSVLTDDATPTTGNSVLVDNNTQNTVNTVLADNNLNLLNSVLLDHASRPSWQISEYSRPCVLYVWRHVHRWSLYWQTYLLSDFKMAPRCSHLLAWDTIREMFTKFLQSLLTPKITRIYLYNYIRFIQTSHLHLFSINLSRRSLLTGSRATPPVRWLERQCPTPVCRFESS